MYSNRRPYYGLKNSISELFREPVRYIKESNSKESQFEKPYLDGEYPRMHLLPPRRPKKPVPPGPFGPIPRYRATIVFGEALCNWGSFNSDDCVEGPQLVSLEANYFFETEFNFFAQIAKDTTSGVVIETLPPEEYDVVDHQSYRIIFPEDSEGSVVICGYVSAKVLISQTYETVAAGMPVTIRKVPGGLIAQEKGQTGQAKLVESIYGEKSADCGCIEITSSCDPCGSVSTMSWDSDVSASTIDRSDSVTIAVKDGYGPYDWSVSGTGFTLGASQTAGATNTLIADGTACGVATITVTDYCETETSGTVICTTGTWIEDFTISVPQPADWDGVTSCVTHCSAGGTYYGNWGTAIQQYKYIDDAHRINYTAGQGGWCYSEGCSDFSAVNTFADSAEITTETAILLIAPEMGSCPAGCLKDWGISGERWGCA